MTLPRKIVAGIILTILSIGAANAAPMYYTFQGTATAVTDIEGASGIVVSGAIEYVFLIDFDQGGVVTNLDGSISSIVDAFPLYESNGVYNDATMDNFFVDYRAGNAYFGPDGVNNNFLELNTGVDNYAVGKYMITGGDAIGIASFIDPVSLWSIGDEFYSLNVWGNQSELINGNVTLVSISPVPLPGGLALLGFALAGLGLTRRKKSI